MKRLATLALTSLAFFANLAFAATVTSEPALPSDIEAWKKEPAVTCDKHAGKILVSQAYEKKVGDIDLRRIVVVSMNGEKVVQFELWSVVRDPTELFLYVRNSPEKNWLGYTRHEREQGNAQMFAELGLTEAEYDSCNK